MTTVTTNLAYRPRGTDAWVDIDPDSTTGRRLLAAIGLTASSNKEISTMSAQTMTASRPVVIVTPQERLGALVRARAAARRALDFILASPRKVWSSLVETLHLRTAQAKVMAGVKFAGDAISDARAYLGTSGQIGVGLGLIASPTGRTITRWTLLKPFGFLGRMGNRIIDGTVNTLDKLGAPGRWLAGVIEDGREALWEKPTSPIARVKKWAAEKVMPHLELDTWQMRSASDLSDALIGMRLLRLTVTHSGLLMAGNIITWGYAAMRIISNTTVSLWGRGMLDTDVATVEQEEASLKVTNPTPTEKAAAKTEAAHVAQVKAAAEAAVADEAVAVAETVVKEAEKKAATNGAAPLSRAARRRVERAEAQGKLPASVKS